VDFFIHCIKNLKETGAVAPSSKFLARDLMEPLSAAIGKNSAPINILELGPGTGSLTSEIVKLLRPDDHLDVVEVQEEFFEIITQKFRRSNITVYFRDILQFQSDRHYKFIFSSLPYDNMPHSIIRQIWQKKLSLCAPEAYICYFKYLKFRKFKSKYEEQMVNKYKQNKKMVFRNLPPANIYTLQISENGSSATMGTP
jgi:phospholipid N-methyltransferase